MEWPPEPETAEKIVWYMAAASFLIAVISGIGEYRGWWNLIGEVGMIFGTIASVLLSGVGVLMTGSRRQVGRVESAVGQVHRAVGMVHGAVQWNGAMLQNMDTKLEGLDKLERLDELDKIQLELDVQTGVLGDQLGVLREIRDAS